MSHSDEIKQLITKSTRRLYKLKEQKAVFGLNTAPEISIEIEDIEAELERLQIIMKLLENMPTDVEQTFFEFAEKTENKFNRQKEAYLDKFDSLHQQLEAWKNVHNLLHNTHLSFAFCRTYIFKFSKPAQEIPFYAIEIHWRTCRQSLLQLEPWANYLGQLTSEMDETLVKTGQSEWLEESSNSRQRSKLWRLADEIDKALNGSNAIALPEHLSIFGDLVDKLLYGADKKLLDVVNQIKHLRRPSSV